MKTILLLRHAKSDWGEPGLVDFDRPLAKRGLKDAPRMGKALALFDHVPDLIIASPAKRAKETAELAAEACGYQNTIRWEEPFYHSGSITMIETLRSLPPTIKRPLLVGHNPTMADTAAALCHRHQINAYEDIQYPTAGLICFDVNITDWANLTLGDGVLRWFLIPRLVKALGV